ncbi:MAG: hypothetical protein ACPGTP_05045 [Bacteroidia bacterium]
MRIVLGLLLGFLLAGNVSAQIVEVNPNVNWKYIRSQNLELQSESVYQYEFPAEKGFDYKFNLFYDKKDIGTYINVYDIQMKPIATILDSNAYKTTKLEFRVPESGTYIVTLGYNNNREEDTPKADIELILIRREIVE